MLDDGQGREGGRCLLGDPLRQLFRPQRSPPEHGGDLGDEPVRGPEVADPQVRSGARRVSVAFEDGVALTRAVADLVEGPSVRQAHGAERVTKRVRRRATTAPDTTKQDGARDARELEVLTKPTGRARALHLPAARACDERRGGPDPLAALQTHLEVSKQHGKRVVL